MLNWLDFSPKLTLLILMPVGHGAQTLIALDTGDLVSVVQLAKRIAWRMSIGSVLFLQAWNSIISVAIEHV